MCFGGRIKKRAKKEGQGSGSLSMVCRSRCEQKEREEVVLSAEIQSLCIFFQIPNYLKMKSKILLIILLTCLISINGLDIGECVRLNSDGWSCAECRANYHLFEGRCYIDILGCTDYYSGNICQQCENGYMLVNNLCCDEICLAKILSTGSGDSIITGTNATITTVLQQILTHMQNGKLQGSLFSLAEVKLVNYLQVDRYFLLYKIISSYESDYYLKRAIVDYNPSSKAIVLVDWTLISAGKDITIYPNNLINPTDFKGVLTTFPNIYKTIGANTQYNLTIDVLSEVKEYQVLNYDYTANTVNLLIIYNVNPTTTHVLVNSSGSISTFTPYTRIFKTLIEMTNAFGNNNELSRCYTYWQTLPGNSDVSPQITVESAQTIQMITYKVYSENATHTIETIIQYIRQTDTYQLFIINVYPKIAPPTTAITLPAENDITREFDGQIETTFVGRTTVFTGNFLQLASNLINSHTFPTDQEKTLIQTLLNSKPARIVVLTNCKYTEVTFAYLYSSTYYFVYFIQDNVSYKINYLGYLTSANLNDPSTVLNAQYSQADYVVAFDKVPTFTQSSIKQLSQKTTSLLAKTTISVLDSYGVNKYFIYLNKVSGQPSTKMFSCVCAAKIYNKTRESWVDVLGLTGYRTDNPNALSPPDADYNSTIDFIRISIPSIAGWKVTRVESNQYGLATEYIVILENEGLRAIVVVVKAKTPAAGVSPYTLVNFEILSLPQFTAFNPDYSELVKKESLPNQPTTNSILQAILAAYPSQSLTSLVGIIRNYDSPKTESDIVIFTNTTGSFAYIFVTNVTDPSKIKINLLDIRSVTQTIVDNLNRIGTIGPNSNTVTQANTPEKHAAGVIFDGEVFQIENNIQYSKLSPEILDLIAFITKSEGVAALAGNLTHVEQHSDAVVNEFALSYLTAPNTYTRYFVIKPIDPAFAKVYLGKQSISANPQSNLYFLPVPSLNITGNEQKFQGLASFVSSNKNNIDLPAASITHFWETKYPTGLYTIIYFKTNIFQAAAYVITLTSASTSTLVYFIQTVTGSIFDIVPTVQLTSTDPTSQAITNSHIRRYTELTTVTNDQTSSNTTFYTLVFDYAAQTTKSITSNSLNSFETCSFEVTWNNVVVATIIPRDPLKNTYSVQVPVAPGGINLQFNGLGTVDGIGASIDSVRLFAPGQTTNLIQNSDFEDPKVGDTTTAVTGYIGWIGVGGPIYIGNGNQYNPNWKGSQVAVFDNNGQQNNKIRYSLGFGPNNEFITVPILKLSFAYSANTADNIPVGNPLGSVIYGGRTYSLTAPQTATYFSNYVLPARGSNSINFTAIKSYNIDNVSLIVNGTTTELLYNGDFEDFSINALDTSCSTMRGWNGSVLIAHGPSSSPAMNTQVARVYAGQFLTQSVGFNSGFVYVPNVRVPAANAISYLLRFYSFAPTGSTPASVSGDVNWNNVRAHLISARDTNVLHNTVLLYPRAGTNTLKFSGVANDAKGSSVIIDNITMVLKSGGSNIIINGDFQYGVVQNNIYTANNIYGWTGNLKIGPSQPFNTLWQKSQVSILDIASSVSFSQSYTFDSKLLYTPEDKWSAPLYNISFWYAPKVNAGTVSTYTQYLLKVMWNFQLVGYVNATQKDAPTQFTTQFRPVALNNSLSFTAVIGEFFIDNVTMVLATGSGNIIKNGEFQSPNVGQTQTESNQVPGWNTTLVIGYSSYFTYFTTNPWSYPTQLLIIDPAHSPVYQILSFNEQYEYTPNISNPSNGLELSIKWAASENVPLSTSVGVVNWNNIPVISLVCGDYGQIYSKTVIVYPVSGSNQLLISGINSTSSKGITVDNVTLIPQFGTFSQNLVINGEFENPNIEDNWIRVYNFRGWTGSIDIGYSKQFNNAWPETQVANLDGPSVSFYQGFNYDPTNNIFIVDPINKGDYYTLSFTYAAPSGQPTTAGQIQVIWNDFIAGFIAPYDDNVYVFTTDVLVNSGNNTLAITQVGSIDNFGLLIDNVVLVKKGTTTPNIVSNGDFESPNIGPEFKISNTHTSWIGTFNIANSSLYNTKMTPSQVAILDVGKNVKIIQGFVFRPDMTFVAPTTPTPVPDAWILSFRYAANNIGTTDLTTSTADLFWNGVKFASVKPTDFKVNTFYKVIPAVAGDNTFTILGTGAQDGAGLLVDSFRLYQAKTNTNFFVNDEFSAQGEYSGPFIPGWYGNVEVRQASKLNSLWLPSSLVNHLDVKGSTNTNITQGFKFTDNLVPISLPVTPVFNLSLEYAASTGIDYKLAKAQIFWNNLPVGTIEPTDFNKGFLSLIVVPVKGVNTLSLRPSGNLTNKGLTVDNIKITMINKTANMFFNGNFDYVNFKKTIVSSKNIPGWVGNLIEVGPGSSYNPVWPDTQVCNLADRYLSGTVIIDTNGNPVVPASPPVLVLSFSYAARIGRDLATSGGSIFWNYEEIFRVRPTTYDVTSLTLEFSPIVGPNVLSFSGDNTTIDDYGLGIDNLAIVVKGTTTNLVQNGDFQLPNLKKYSVIGAFPFWSGVLEVGYGKNYNPGWTEANSQICELDSNSTQFITQTLFFNEKFNFVGETGGPNDLTWIEIAIAYLKNIPDLNTCTVNNYQETLYTNGAVELFTSNCTIKNVLLQCTISVSVATGRPSNLNYYECKSVDPNNPFVPPGIPPTENPYLNQTNGGNNLVDIANNKTVTLIDPNQVNEAGALTLINQFEKTDTLVELPLDTPLLTDIVLYLRATYEVLEGAPVIKFCQDKSGSGSPARYVIYFFIKPVPGGKYTVIRAVVDYDSTTSEIRIYVLGVDIFIQSEKVVLNVTTVTDEVSQNKPLDIDIAYGYETLPITEDLKNTLSDVLYQINRKYPQLTSAKTLTSVEQLPLKSGKINYKLGFTDSVTNAKVKFIVFYDPLLKSILLLNPVSLPNNDLFVELSDAEKQADTSLQTVLLLINKLHAAEYKNAKLECVTKGTLATTIEYRVIWVSNDIKYRSFVRLPTNGQPYEVLFGEVETIALDHYRLDEFEKLYISNYQKMTDFEIKNDNNFRLAYQYLTMANLKLGNFSLIGVASKPLNLGYLYNMYFKTDNSSIIRIETFVELYTLKVTVRALVHEDFSTGFIQLATTDTASKNLVSFLSSTATNPALTATSTVTSIIGKDFVFGVAYKVTFTISGGSYVALVYHDKTAKKYNLINWAPQGSINGCQTLLNGSCALCAEGQVIVNGFCVYGYTSIFSNIVV